MPEELNFGLIEDPRSEGEKQRDYIFGADNGISKVELYPNSNCNPFMPVGEKQHAFYFDSMGCVSFSYNNVIEATMNRKISLGLITLENITWLNDNGYIDENGEFNSSDRWLALVSETTKSGNYQWKVAEAVRKIGLIPESMFPFPKEYSDPKFLWKDFYSGTTLEMYALAKEFTKRFDVNYEWVEAKHDLMIAAMKYSAIQITCYAYSKIGSDGIYYNSPEAKRRNHAVVASNEEEAKNIRWLFDTYVDRNTDEGYFKKMAWDYIFGSGLQVTVTELNIKEDTMKLFKGVDKTEVYAVGKDNKLRHIINEATFNQGNEAGLWGGWDEIEEKEESEINQMEKGNSIAFIIN